LKNLSVIFVLTHRPTFTWRRKNSKMW